MIFYYRSEEGYKFYVTYHFTNKRLVTASRRPDVNGDNEIKYYTSSYLAKPNAIEHRLIYKDKTLYDKSDFLDYLNFMNNEELYSEDLNVSLYMFVDENPRVTNRSNITNYKIIQSKDLYKVFRKYRDKIIQINSYSRGFTMLLNNGQIVSIGLFESCFIPTPREPIKIGMDLSAYVLSFESRCSLCGSYSYRIANAQASNQICDSCKTSHKKCDVCGGFMKNYMFKTGSDTCMLCQFKDYKKEDEGLPPLHPCPICGDTHTGDSLACDVCVEDESLQSYHNFNSDYYKWRLTSPKDTHKYDKITFGLEIELDNINEGFDFYTIKRTLSDTMTNYWHYETDSSLDSGFELITFPLTYNGYKDYVKKDLDEFLEYAKGMGYVDSSNAGLHINVAHKDFDDEWLDNICYLTEKFYSDFNSIYRRGSSSYARRTYRSKASVEKVSHKNYDEKYKIIYIKRGNLVEFRGFKSTNVIDEITAGIELVRNIVILADTRRKDITYVTKADILRVSNSKILNRLFI